VKQCVKALSNPAVLLLLAGSALAVSVVHADHAKAMAVLFRLLQQYSFTNYLVYVAGEASAAGG
jgi:hypothetical protein